MPLGIGAIIGIGSALLGASSARKQRKAGAKAAANTLAFQQEQAALLEEQKDIYRNMTFTNSYENAQNSYAGLQTNFENLAAGFKNPFANFKNAFANAKNHFAGMKNYYDGLENNYEGMKNAYSGLENEYENMENRFEDATVDRKAADFAAQQGQQQRANIMQGLRGAAGSSGIAALAQTLANQGQIQAQQQAATIGQQERQNKMLAAQEGSRIDMMQRGEAARLAGQEAGANMQLQQLERGEASRLQTLYAQGASQNQMSERQGAMQIQTQKAQGEMQAQQMRMQGEMMKQQMQLQGATDARNQGIARENLIAGGDWNTQMAQMAGADALQQAEMGRQATLLGMQYGSSAGANASHQQALHNQMMGNASANNMMMNALSGLGGINWGSGGGGGGGIFHQSTNPVSGITTGGFGIG